MLALFPERLKSSLFTLKQRARALKAETIALYLAARHPETPRLAKWLALIIVAYAFSPIDLIPDFVPVLGHVDDLILIPLGIALIIHLIPKHVMTQCRAQAELAFAGGKPVNRTAGVIIGLIWTGLALLGVVWGFRLVRG